VIQSTKPYHSRAFPIPQVHKETIKKEVRKLKELGVLEWQPTSEWAALSCIQNQKPNKSSFFEIPSYCRQTPWCKGRHLCPIAIDGSAASACGCAITIRWLGQWPRLSLRWLGRWLRLSLRWLGRWLRLSLGWLGQRWKNLQRISRSSRIEDTSYRTLEPATGNKWEATEQHELIELHITNGCNGVIGGEKD
jgi:hypothetical protein